MRNLKKNERGAALIETAITIPIVLLITVGLFEFGRAYQTWQVLTNAAREGARVAVLADTTDAQIQTTVENYLTGGRLDKTLATVVLDRTMPMGSNTASRIEVNYQFDFAVLNPVAKLVVSDTETGSNPLVMQAVAVMRNE
jgi:Flp pilus assembly protein TadG